MIIYYQYLVITTLQNNHNNILNECKQLYELKIDVDNMLSERLGINYKKYNLILDKKQQNKEFGNLCLFIPIFMRDLWENPKALAKILSKLSFEESKGISKFITLNLYDKIFTSNNNEDQLIYIISLLLKDEINNLENDNINLEKFLNETICECILKELIQKKDVQYFFKETLDEVIKKIELESNISWIFEPKTIFKKLKLMEENHENTLNNDFKENKIKVNQKIQNFNKKYLIDLKLENLKSKISTYQNKDMKEYLEKKISDCQSSPTLYSTDKIINTIFLYSNSNDIFMYYINSFMEVIDIINILFQNLFLNSNSLPYSKKCICKIISILIKKKYPKASKIEQNTFLAKFIFDKLIFPIFDDPSFLLLINEYLISSKTIDKLRTIKKIIQIFIYGKLYNEDEHLTPFNNYFIEKMPDLISFLNDICQAKLPSFINELINDKLPENFKYDYFKENPNENIFYRNICFNFKELLIIIENAIKCKNDNFLDKNVLSRIESNFPKFKESLGNLEEEKEINYFLLSDFINNKKYDKLLNLKRDKPYFYLKELTKIVDENQNITNNIIKIKNFFIYQNYLLN